MKRRESLKPPAKKTDELPWDFFDRCFFPVIFSHAAATIVSFILRTLRISQISTFSLFILFVLITISFTICFHNLHVSISKNNVSGIGNEDKCKVCTSSFRSSDVLFYFSFSALEIFFSKNLLLINSFPNEILCLLYQSKARGFELHITDLRSLISIMAKNLLGIIYQSYLEYGVWINTYNNIATARKY